MNSSDFKTIEELKGFLNRNRHNLSDYDIDLIKQAIDLLESCKTECKPILSIDQLIKLAEIAVALFGVTQ